MTNRFISAFSGKVLYAVLIVLGLALIIGGTYYFHEATKIIPDQAVLTAVYNANKAKSFRFRTKSVIILNDKEQELSDIAGERAEENVFHVKGSMVDTPVDVYQINNVTYRLDHITNKWIVMEYNPVAQESLLMTELNPLSAINFTSLESVTLIGKERIGRRKNFKLECIPVVENKWLNNYFSDFRYTIWIDRKTRTLTKAAIIAKSKENEAGSLRVEVEFFDYNKEIEITPPEVK